MSWRAGLANDPIRQLHRNYVPELCETFSTGEPG